MVRFDLEAGHDPASDLLRTSSPGDFRKCWTSIVRRATQTTRDTAQPTDTRSTEDVAVLLKRINEETVDDLAETLVENEFWGLAMPLSSMYEMIDHGDNIWVAPKEQLTPHLEVKFTRDEFDRASLENAMTT